MTSARRAGRSISTFWAFVDLGAAPTAVFIAPDAWVRRDIHEAHDEYLEGQRNRQRPQNPASTHHAIATDRVARWRERWDLLDDAVTGSR